MSEEVSEQDGIDNVFMARVVSFAPWYIAVGTAISFLWLYLVVGEFVLAGLPESLGWCAVLGTAGANYWALEQRFLGFTPDSARRQRIMTLVVVGASLVLLILLGFLFGSALPEPVATLLLFVSVGLAAFWRRTKRRRLYASLPREPHWRVAARIVLVILVTMAAFGAMVARYG